MKKVFVTLSVILLTAVSAFAGGDKTATRYFAPRFTQGWFIDVAGTYSIMAGNDVTYHDITTYYGWGDTQFGFSAKLGRRVGHSTAVRLGYDWHPSQNENGAFNFTSVHVDLMESPLDLFFGYKPDRFYTLWIYGGFGVLSCDKTHNYPSLVGFKDNLEYGFHGGLMNNFRISNSIDFHIDLTAVSTKWSFDSNHFDGHTLWHRSHFDYSGMVGLMWYLGGRRFDAAEPVIEAGDCSEQENRIKELTGEIKDLQEQLAHCGDNNQPCDTIYIDGEPQLITYPFSIFFNKGSYELRDGRDRINLQEIAQAAIDHNLMVNLRGTCDAATASAAFNKTLAENRCNKVKNELVKIGVPADNIVIEAVGGVTELKPAEYDRRVIVSFSEKK